MGNLFPASVVFFSILSILKSHFNETNSVVRILITFFLSIWWPCFLAYFRPSDCTNHIVAFQNSVVFYSLVAVARLCPCFEHGMSFGLLTFVTFSYFYSNFRFIAKLIGRNRSFSCISCHCTCTDSAITNIPARVVPLLQLMDLH